MPCTRRAASGGPPAVSTALLALFSGSRRAMASLYDRRMSLAFSNCSSASAQGGASRPVEPKDHEQKHEASRGACWEEVQTTGGGRVAAMGDWDPAGSEHRKTARCTVPGAQTHAQSCPVLLDALPLHTPAFQVDGHLCLCVLCVDARTTPAAPHLQGQQGREKGSVCSINGVPVGSAFGADSSLPVSDKCRGDSCTLTRRPSVTPSCRSPSSAFRPSSATRHSSSCRRQVVREVGEAARSSLRHQAQQQAVKPERIGRDTT